MDYSVIIIGSGPAGLSSAVYSARAGKSTLVIEKEYEGTGQIALSSQVDNYLGYHGISGYDLGEHFREHALALGVEIKTATVTSIAKADDGFEVRIKVRKKEEVLKAENIVYAAGAKHRLLGVEGEAEFAGKGVSYCATCDGSFFKGKNVAVVGGGDTALDDALYMSSLASQVYLIHRRDTFRGSFTALEKLKKRENVKIITPAQLVAIKGKERLESIELNTGEEIELDGVFIAVGMVPETDLLADLVERDDMGYIKAGEDCRTSAPAIYVAGDVRSKALRQVVTAVADGANAINSLLTDEK